MRNSVLLPASKFVVGEPDDENVRSALTSRFSPTPSSLLPTNFQRESSPEAFESRNGYSPPHLKPQSVESFPKKLKWSDRSIVSPVNSDDELLWPCEAHQDLEPHENVEPPGERCSTSETRRWGDSANFSSVTRKHEDHLEVQTGHCRWSEPSLLLKNYRRPVDYRPFQETITGPSHWTSSQSSRTDVRKGFPLESQLPKRLFSDFKKNEHEGYNLLRRYSPKLNPIRRPPKLPQGRPWRDSCEFSPELFPHLARKQENLLETKLSPRLSRMSLPDSQAQEEKNEKIEQLYDMPSKTSTMSVPATPVRKLKDNGISQPPPRPRRMPQGRDFVRDGKVQRKPKLYSVFWRKDYNLKKKASKNEVVTRTRVIKRGGKFSFEKCDKLKRDPKTKKFCFVFTIPPGPAAKFMIYVMANRYKESCELQRRYNCWLHIDLLFNTEDLLQEYEGLVTLKWQNDTHVYSLARRILEIINTKLKGINVVAIDPPLKARTQIRDKLLHMSSKLIKRVRTELRCFFHIVLLPEENLTRIIVGGLNNQRLERGLKEILQVINPEIQKKYNGDGFVIREVGGEVKLVLESLSSFKK